MTGISHEFITMTAYVYMMSNKPRGSLYIGVTSDLENRVWEHKNKINKGFTKKYNLTELVWFESHPNIVLAIHREKLLKEYRREWKINLVETLNPTWIDLSEQIFTLENIYEPPKSSKYWSDYQ